MPTPPRSASRNAVGGRQGAGHALPEVGAAHTEPVTRGWGGDGRDMLRAGMAVLPPGRNVGWGRALRSSLFGVRGWMTAWKHE